MTTRRRVLLGLGLGTLSVAIPTLAQQPTKIWRVGFLSVGTRPPVLDASQHGVFLRAMRELGYVEGQNLIIDWRFAEGNYERLSHMVSELVGLKVNAIAVTGTPAAIVAKRITTAIPIIMVYVSDPVESGLVASLAHPGGNVTGLSLQGTEVVAKQLELLKVVVPKLSRIGILGNNAHPGNVIVLKHLQAAGQKTGVMVLPMRTTTPAELESGFAEIKRERAEAIVILNDGSTTKHIQKIAALAAKYRLPSISEFRHYTAAGIMMNFGKDAGEFYRLAATYVDKIFKGAMPSDLPIQQPTKFTLVINGKTAKALGLTIPPELLLRADEVIE